jgi:hypothetical protein
MPVVPTTAYSQTEDALNLARTLVNDRAWSRSIGTVPLRRKLHGSGAAAITDASAVESEPRGHTKSRGPQPRSKRR